MSRSFSSSRSTSTSRASGPSIAAGAIAFTVTPWGASSVAARRVTATIAGLRRRVVRPGVAARRERRVAREVHDPAGAPLPQRRADDPAAEVRATQVRREHVVPLLDVDLPERAELGACRVVDQRVRRGVEVLEQPLPRCELADVVLERLCTVAELARDPLDALDVDVRRARPGARRRGAAARWLRRARARPP